MNKNFYYDGRQIKNYLIGFASIFSEIPYQDRKGILKSVPIHYGSPSDIISYLEMNVDNADTHNRNRLKDVTVPLFSFRMTSIERNVERRRAPLDTITVDLRSLGYSTGYVAMKPAPFKFNFELLLWASSDYQAFEITEQIVPYFNSPQQVTIEPLPKCPISTTEVFLESFEIDTEPDSQKYSALVTMTFSLTGWLLSQPRIWSTNMKFELSMLDKENLNNGISLNDTDYSVGHEIIDNNSRPIPKTDDVLSLETIDNFITRTPLVEIYGDKLDWYNELVLAGRIDKNTGQIINTDDLIIDWKGTEKTLYLATMEMLVDDMEDVKYLFENEKLKFALSSHTLKDDIYIIGEMYEDATDTIEIYLTLLDNNLVTKGFNRTLSPISNSDKLNMFGTSRVDIETIMDRMKTYLAGVENIKVKKDRIQEIDAMNERYSIMLFDIHLPLSEIPIEFKEQDIIIDYDKSREFDYVVDSYDDKSQKLKLKVITSKNKNIDSLDSKPTSIILVYQLQDMIKADEILIDYNYDGSFFIEIPMVVGYTKGFNIITKADSNSQDLITSSFNIKGVYIQDNSDITTKFDTDKIIFNSTTIPNKNIEVTDEYSEIFDENMIFNDRFINLDEYVIASLLYTRITSKIGILTNDDGYKIDDEESELKKEQIEKDPYVKIFLNKYNKTIDDLLNYRHGLRKAFTIVNKSIDKIQIPNEHNSTQNDMKEGQKIIAPDLAVVLSLDKDGNPIYDINGDGYIDIEDLKLLGSNVDNPDDYDFEIKFGVWYKRFRIENMSSERIARVSADLKIIYYLTEKDNMNELKDYLLMWDKGYLSDGFDILDDEKKQMEIKALGYNISELDDKLLFFRLFASAINNIMVFERDYILYMVDGMNEESKAMLYRTEGLMIDKIVMGKFLERYFKLIIDEDMSIKDEQLFRLILPYTIGEYYAEAHKFNLMWLDIKNTQFFKDSLNAHTPWLDEILPEVTERISTL